MAARAGMTLRSGMTKAQTFAPAPRFDVRHELIDEKEGCVIVPNRLPTDAPPFTKADLQAVIPSHCFERSIMRSMLYVFMDLTLAIILYGLSTYIEHPMLPAWAPVLLWPLYWMCQGNICTGLWVIAHECGHRAFSNNILIGDTVGLILHSCLLVPYHPWRISHAKHHRSTNDMDRDEVFVPYTRSEVGDTPGLLTGPVRVLNIFKMLVFGWPAYLFSNTTSHKTDRPTNHFNPHSPLFLPQHFTLVVISDAALVAVTTILVYLGYSMGFWWLVKVYVVPYLIVNMWLVLITNLQHTDLAIPHYRGEEWTWLKGALCTMDRDFGVLNKVFHHITDTHVAHHLFSNIPHYHAMEATKALIPALGEFYVRDSAAPGLLGVAQTLWKSSQYCQFVEDFGGTLWFKFK
jgi:omega-6 fatty acid desaturase (delta-12 desaturase)